MDAYMAAMGGLLTVLLCASLLWLAATWREGEEDLFALLASLVAAAVLAALYLA